MFKSIQNQEIMITDWGEYSVDAIALITVNIPFSSSGIFQHIANRLPVQTD